MLKKQAVCSPREIGRVVDIPSLFQLSERGDESRPSQLDAVRIVDQPRSGDHLVRPYRLLDEPGIAPEGKHAID